MSGCLRSLPRAVFHQKIRTHIKREIGTTVDVVSDPRCPWCYVAHHRLKNAIAALPDQSNIRLRWIPFLLDDTLPMDGVDRREYYRQRFGEEAMDRVHEQMTKVFQRENMGHEYVSDGTACSSLPAHRLLAYVERQFPGDIAISERVASELFRRYFSAADSSSGFGRGENIASIDVLEQVAADSGIVDTDAVRDFLKSDALTDYVVTTAASGKARGITVPHITINEAVELDGTPETEELIDLLQRPGSSLEPISTPGIHQSWLKTTSRDLQAARKVRWRSSNLLPRMMAIQGWPVDCPFDDTVHFQRLDESNDSLFYDEPRLDHHLDAPARARLSEHYADCLQSVLDDDRGTVPFIAENQSAR